MIKSYVLYDMVNIDSGKTEVMVCFGAWWHQAITWANVVSLVRFFGIHLRERVP